MIRVHEVQKIFEEGSKEEKIKTLASLENIDESKIIQLIISCLDDTEIEVRGEAFSCLVLNQNKISEFLISNLKSESKNIRGFCALVLANRKDLDAISSITILTKDTSPMVRACALGSLGFLKASQASKFIHECFNDTNLEVRKSAVKAAIDIGDILLENEIEKISQDKDEELEKLLILAQYKK